MAGEELKMFGWAGTVFGILGALLVACNLGLNDIGYIFFTIGAMFSLTNSVKMRDNSNIVLWAVFLIINIVGLFSYIK